MKPIVSVKEVNRTDRSLSVRLPWSRILIQSPLGLKFQRRTRMKKLNVLVISEKGKKGF